MGEVLQFRRRDKGFDTEVTAVLIAAYERAVAAIEQSGRPHGLCEVAARRIIALASKGERNADRLCAAALATVSKSATSSAAKTVRQRPGPPVRLAPHLILIDTRHENAGDGPP